MHTRDGLKVERFFFFPSFFSAPTPTSQDLMKQEILVGQMRAAACLYLHQSNLRSILCQPVPADPNPSSTHALMLATQGLSHEGAGSEEEGPVGEAGPQQTNLLQQILMVATQPSPLKAMFSMEEMQVRLWLRLVVGACLYGRLSMLVCMVGCLCLSVWLVVSAGLEGWLLVLVCVVGSQHYGADAGEIKVQGGCRCLLKQVFSSSTLYCCSSLVSGNSLAKGGEG